MGSREGEVRRDSRHRDKFEVRSQGIGGDIFLVRPGQCAKANTDAREIGGILEALQPRSIEKRPQVEDTPTPIREFDCEPVIG